MRRSSKTIISIMLIQTFVLVLIYFKCCCYKSDNALVSRASYPTEYVDVVEIPEPSSFMLLSVGVLVLLSKNNR